MLNFQNPFSIPIRILIKNASLACSQIIFILQDFTWVSPSSIKISEEDRRLHASVLAHLQPKLPLQSSHRGFYADPSGLGVYRNHSRLLARPTLLREQRPQLQAGPSAATATPPGPAGHLLLPGHKWTTLTQTGPSESPSYTLPGTGTLSQLRSLELKTSKLRSYGAAAFRHVCASRGKSLIEEERTKLTPSGAHTDTQRRERGSAAQTALDGFLRPSWTFLSYLWTWTALNSLRYLHPSNDVSLHCLLSYCVVFFSPETAPKSLSNKALCTSESKTSPNQRDAVVKKVPPFQDLHGLNKPHFTLNRPFKHLNLHLLSPSLLQFNILHKLLPKKILPSYWILLSLTSCTDNRVLSDLKVFFFFFSQYS